MIAITAEKLTKSYGQMHAVDHVDVRIEPGELFFLLGPSGCGKTTLLRMIAGLLDPTSGTLKFGDRDVTHMPSGQRKCAMVFQNYALWPHMTIRQNVGFGLDVKKIATAEKKAQVDRVMKTVQIDHLADRKPGQLSGGQQQRVALARALVVSPDVLLLDEPLSNLDAKLRFEMRSEIRRICKSTNTTSVYVTHDQEEALSMADRIAVMRDGRIAQCGPPEEVYDKPVNHFVADFLGSANFLPGVVESSAGHGTILSTALGNLRAAMNGHKANDRVTCMIRPERIRLLDDNEQAANVIDGTHTETIFRGGGVRHNIRLSNGQSLHIDETRKSAHRVTRPNVRLGFEAEDLILLSENT
jgi:iron(III) transport system ATP-binding protein